MTQLAEQLRTANNPYLAPGQQVVDETGLSGFFEFQYKFTPRPLLAQAGSDGITLQAAFEKLGLTLEPKDIKVPAIVVDSATAEFTPNPPDLAKRLPPAPAPQFEVAVLKPSPPEATQPRAQLRPTGQVDISAAPLNRIIGLAWNLPTTNSRAVSRRPQVAGDGAASTSRPARSPTPNPANQAQARRGLRVRLMLRSLLVDQFQIKWHMEDRPMPAFTIVADSPKMAKGDPTKRTRCFEGAPARVAGRGEAAAVPAAGDVRERVDGAVRPAAAPDRRRLHARGRARQDWPAGRLRLHAQLQSRSSRCRGRGPKRAQPTRARRSTRRARCHCRTPSGSSSGSGWKTTKRPVPVLVIDSINETPTG